MFWLLLALPVVGLVHELGHAATARIAGYRVSSLGFGHAYKIWSPLFRTQLKHCRFYVGLHFWAGGRCVTVPKAPRLGWLWAHFLGGVFAQALLAIPLMWLSADHEGAYVVAQFNFLVMGFNLLPWKFRGGHSDGWNAVASLVSNSKGGFSLVSSNLLQQVWDHEVSVGAHLGEEWCRITWARLAVAAGEGHGEADFLTSKEAMKDLEMEGLRICIAANWHCMEGRPLAALAACQSARTLWGPEFSDFSSDLIYLAEARAFLSMNEAGRARTCLSMVAGSADVVAQEAVVVGLQIAISEGQPDRVERMARRLISRLNRSFLDPEHVSMTLVLSAELLRSDGRTQSAMALERVAWAQAERQSMAQVYRELVGVPVTGSSATLNTANQQDG